jgi:hypothetical protein
MELSLFEAKLKIIEARYNHNMKPLAKLCEHFLGLDAIIPKGEYKGRWGRITEIVIDQNGNCLGIIIPYRVVGDTNDFISDVRPDARTYWDLFCIKEIRVPKEYKNNIKKG